jgi:hypothetical protein
METKATRERFESYEVFDDKGNSVGRVILPRSRRMFGTNRATVFLNRQPPRTAARSGKPRAA